MKVCLFCLGNTSGLNTNFCSYFCLQQFKKQVKASKMDFNEMTKWLSESIEKEQMRRLFFSKKIHLYIHKYISKVKEFRFQQYRNAGQRDYERRLELIKNGRK